MLSSSLVDADAATLEAMADQAFHSGRMAEALALQEQALACHVAAGRPEEEARCRQTVGHMHFQRRDYLGAIRAYRLAIRLWERLDSPQDAATAWARLAEVFQQAGRHTTALRAFDKSLALLRGCGACKDIGIVLNDMAVSHRELGQRPLALQCHERALQIRRDLADHEGLAATLHNLGSLHMDAGALQCARSALEEARQLRKTLGDRAGLSRTELRLGLLHEQLGEHVQAAACYERALELSTTDGRGDLDNQVAALANMGGLMVAQGQAAPALPLLERARSLLTTRVPTPALAMVQYNLGLARASADDLAGALAALDVSERIQRRCGDYRNLSATLAAKGVVVLRKGHAARAQALLLEALDLQTRLGEQAARAHTLQLLSRLDTGHGLQAAAEGAFSEAMRVSALAELEATAIDFEAAIAGTLPLVVEQTRRTLQ